MPFIEQERLYRSTDTSIIHTPVPTYYCPARRRPTAYKSGARSDYAGNGGKDNYQGASSPNGIDGVFYRTDSGVRNLTTGIPDGASTTLLFGEKQLHPTTHGTAGGDNESSVNPGWEDDCDVIRFARQGGTGSDAVFGPAPDTTHSDITKPTYWSRRFGGPHEGYFLGSMCDASVRSIRFSVNPQTFMRLILSNDGLSYNPNDF